MLGLIVFVFLVYLENKWGRKRSLKAKPKMGALIMDLYIYIWMEATLEFKNRTTKFDYVRKHKKKYDEKHSKK